MADIYYSGGTFAQSSMFLYIYIQYRHVETGSHWENYLYLLKTLGENDFGQNFNEYQKS